MKNNASVTNTGKKFTRSLGKENITEESTTTPFTATTVAQATVQAREWFAGLAQGVWPGGVSALCIEWGVSTAGTSSTTQTISPVFRKLIDSILFTQSDFATLASGPTPYLLISASLGLGDANGNNISEYTLFGGGLNLDKASFGSGIPIVYTKLNSFFKTSAQSLQVQVTCNV